MHARGEEEEEEEEEEEKEEEEEEGRKKERKKEEEEEERTNEFFINEGKGISTILFFIQPSDKTKSTKTIENKIITNSKTHINY